VEIVLALVIVAVVVWFVTVPLRRPGDEREKATSTAEDPELADLEARKEAKYREIRDAELDYRTGKLSEEHWRALDRSLRAEAVELLRRLDEFG
jgi:flagellar biosynthesis/type III secretory pathway M-ring protein FliF/YscJ